MAFLEAYCNASTGSNMNGGSDENASPSYAATNGGWDSTTGVFTPTAGDPSASVTVGQLASVFTDGATTPVFVARVTAVNATTVTVSTTAKMGTAPTTGVTSPVAVNAITLTANPFADAPNGDFDLNAVLGGGATCKNAGLGTFTETASNYTGTLGFPDLGAAQHQETGVIIGTVLGR